MKKLLPFLLLLVTLSLHAQISFENNYPNGGVSTFPNNNYLRLIKLSTSGYKYAMNNQTTLTLYNLNHTVFKTISIPPITGTLSCSSCNPNVFYISETLFDTNPSTVEYFFFYSTQVSVGHVRVYDELGNTLFSKDSVNYQGSVNYGNEEFISYTPSGAKMIIFGQYSGAFVYSLPGTLPCHDCTNGITTSIVKNNDGVSTQNISNYPNPAAGQTTIEYILPQGTTIADLVFYNVTGQEVKRFKVTNAFHDIVINTSDLDAGTYYYQLLTNEGFKAGKKMVVVK